jgi:hypothetical protein
MLSKSLANDAAKTLQLGKLATADLIVSVKLEKATDDHKRRALSRRRSGCFRVGLPGIKDQEMVLAGRRRNIAAAQKVIRENPVASELSDDRR